MSSDANAIEDSIKIALDAADAATNVTGEFARIKQEYAAVEGDVKKLYRNATIVFASSAIASLIAVIAASMMYYRTIETMQTNSNTSLEALVIFAENVDKLAAATTALDAAMVKQDELVKESAEAREALGRIETLQEVSQAASLEGFSNLSETTTSAVSQFSGAVLEKFDADLSGHSSDVLAALEELKLAQGELVKAMTPKPDGGMTVKTPMDDVQIKLDTVLMLQKEISAKITAANSAPPKSRTRKVVSKPAPVKAVDEPIKFP